MKKYLRTPSKGGAMVVRPGTVEKFEHALALAPSRDAWLGRWGLTFGDAKAMRLGLDKGTLTIPFFVDGECIAIKRRTLNVDPGGEGSRYFWDPPGNAPPYYLPPEGMDGEPDLIAEGIFKARVISNLLGCPAAALPSGVGVGLPQDGRELFRGRAVVYFADPDEEGQKGIALIQKQLTGVARSLRSIPFPPPGFRVRGDLANDPNDVLRMLRRAYGDQAPELYPFIAAKIRGDLDRAPELLDGGNQDDGSGALGPQGRDLPEIDAGYLDLPTVSEHAWQALIARNDPPGIFRRAGLMACLERDDEGVMFIRALTQDRLRHLLGQFASWYTERKTGKVSALPPLHVVKDMLARPHPPLPILGRIVHAPVFDETGTVTTTPGYHPTARTYFDPAKGFAVPPIPPRPTEADRERARALIVKDLVGDFPFVGNAELAHTVALLLLPYARDLIDGPTPLHLFEKPTPGTGATLLVDLVTLGVTGGRFATMSEGRDEDEWRKRITAKLMSGAAVVVIDNVRARLQSGQLSKAITDRVWADRNLGTLEQLNIPVKCAWAATGNNVALSGEMARRSVRIRLDAKMDRPWLREKFRHPAIRRWAMEHRGEIVWAALVMVQAWLAEGRPDGKGHLGQFETWAKVIGGILDVAGVPGFLGNLTEFYDESDAEGTAWRAFVLAWWDTFEGREVGVSDLWALANPEGGDPFDLGLGEGKRESDRGAKIRLGKRLGEIRDRQFEGHRVVKGGLHRRAVQWKLIRVSV